jgi:hypothetical protein
VTVGQIARGAGACKRVARIYPSGIEAYIDVVRVWLPRPLQQRELQWLKQQCGAVRWLTRSKRWDRDRRYHVWLQLCQPSEAALRFIADREHQLNYTEVALDWMFDNEYERDRAREIANRNMVKKWHGQQQVKFVNGTRYTGKRKVPNKLVTYADKPSRTTGELFCVHIEWRLNGVKALRRAGIDSVNDLLTFNHGQFWHKRLVLKRVNVEKYGTLNNRHVSGRGPKRGSWRKDCDGFVYDYDRTTGARLLRLLAIKDPEWVNGDGQEPASFASTQRVIDHYRGQFNVNRCLEQLDVRHLLPITDSNTLRFGDSATSQRVAGLKYDASP